MIAHRPAAASGHRLPHQNYRCARPAPDSNLFELEAVWISVAKAVKRAGFCTQTIKRRIVEGTLAASRSTSPKGRGHWRIRLGDLDSLMARSRKDKTAKESCEGHPPRSKAIAAESMCWSDVAPKSHPVAT
jgi:hypothetical protein